MKSITINFDDKVNTELPELKQESEPLQFCFECGAAGIKHITKQVFDPSTKKKEPKLLCKPCSDVWALQQHSSFPIEILEDYGSPWLFASCINKRLNILQDTLTGAVTPFKLSSEDIAKTLGYKRDS